MNKDIFTTVVEKYILYYYNEKVFKSFDVEAMYLPNASDKDIATDLVIFYKSNISADKITVNNFIDLAHRMFGKNINLPFVNEYKINELFFSKLRDFLASKKLYLYVKDNGEFFIHRVLVSTKDGDRIVNYVMSLYDYYERLVSNLNSYEEYETDSYQFPEEFYTIYPIYENNESYQNSF